MRLIEFIHIIDEAREAPLYHWVQYEKSADIFAKDAMPGNWEHVIPGSEKAILGTSMTRNPRFDWQAPVRLTMDQAKLAQRHRIIPLDADVAFQYTKMKKATPNAPRGIGGLPRSRRKHAWIPSNQFDEEFVVGDIKPLHAYVLAIDVDEWFASVLRTDTSSQYANIMSDIKTFAKRYEIPLRIRPRAQILKPTRAVREAVAAHVLPEKIYHGTVGTEKAEKIMKDGISAQRVMQPKTHLAPVPGRVYASQSLPYAMIYAMGGQMAGHVDPRVPEKDPYGYVFVIDRSEILDDVQPDEDNVGETWWFADMAMRGDKESLKEFYWENPLARAVYNSEGWGNFRDYVHYFGQSVASPRTLSYVRNGDYAWFAKLGKMMLRKMDDELKEMFITNGAHVSVQGPLVPSQVWRLDRRRTVELKPDGSNFFQVAERIQ